MGHREQLAIAGNSQTAAEIVQVGKRRRWLPLKYGLGGLFVIIFLFQLVWSQFWHHKSSVESALASQNVVGIVSVCAFVLISCLFLGCGCKGHVSKLKEGWDEVQAAKQAEVEASSGAL